ncbi:29314_t:CDS:2, partial [Racocetra persica]
WWVVHFFYRPKVMTTGGEVQRFFFVLHSAKQKQYKLLVVGKKQLPTAEEGSYFSFVEARKLRKEDLLVSLAEKHYHTKTRGERSLPPARCLGEGKYLLEEFNLQKEGDYLISVKNPEQSSPPGTGLVEKQKVKYPSELQEKFTNHRFIPLTCPEFLDYEGTELLLIPKRKSLLTEQDCWEEIKPDDLIKELAKIRTAGELFKQNRYYVLNKTDENLGEREDNLRLIQLVESYQSVSIGGNVCSRCGKVYRSDEKIKALLTQGIELGIDFTVGKIIDKGIEKLLDKPARIFLTQISIKKMEMKYNLKSCVAADIFIHYLVLCKTKTDPYPKLKKWIGKGIEIIDA